MPLLFFAFEQLLFYWTFKALFLALRLLWKALIYAPQLITSYFLCGWLLKPSDTALLWLSMILLLAFLIHLLIMALRQLIRALKERGNLLYIPLLIAWVSYTCIFPVYLVFDPVKYLMHLISAERAVPLTWLFSVAFGLYIYARYDHR